MKKYLYIILLSVTASLSFTSCDDLFDTNKRDGVEINGGLTDATRMNTALNGAYYNLYYYGFCGNFAVSIGDMAADLGYFNFATSHFSSIYTYNVTEDDSYLKFIWEYGYKVADNATRIIEAYPSVKETEVENNQETLDRIAAEAYGLRALAYFYMSNVYCLPYKVEGGTNNGDQLGLAILEKPVGVNDKVQRSTIAETYDAMLKDIDAALEIFKTAQPRGFDYITPTALHALKARIYLYMEEYEKAATEANTAISLHKGKIETTAAGYKTMYTSLATVDETIFNVHVDGTNQLSANSPGTLWSKYGHMLSVEYAKYLGKNDVRQFLTERAGGVSKGGKFTGVDGNPAVSSQRLIGLPEMYLIVTEALLKKSSPDIAGAQEALLNVAKRNNDIKTVADLPSSKDELVTFLEEERIRELAQEGHRFQDCRRWGKKISAYLADEKQTEKSYNFNNFDVSKFCFPIPRAEVNTGAGIVQNPNWADALPELPK